MYCCLLLFSLLVCFLYSGVPVWMHKFKNAISFYWIDHYVTPLSLTTVFLLKSVLPDITTPTFIWFPFAWNIFWFQWLFSIAFLLFHLSVLSFSLFLLLALGLVHSFSSTLSCKVRWLEIFFYSTCSYTFPSQHCFASHCFEVFLFSSEYFLITLWCLLCFQFSSFLFSNVILLWSEILLCISFLIYRICVLTVLENVPCSYVTMHMLLLGRMIHVPVTSTWFIQFCFLPYLLSGCSAHCWMGYWTL